MIQFEDGHWELSETCGTLADKAFDDAKFKERETRNAITIMSDYYVAPEDLGFTRESEFYVFEAPAAPEDEDAAIVPVDAEAEQPLDQIVVGGFDPQSVTVNGTELTMESSLAALRQRCGFHTISTSGSKAKCHRRLVNYHKAAELEAAREAVAAAGHFYHRDPRMQVAPNRPSDEDVARHILTHVPFQGWCEHCAAFRSRPNRHERSDEAKESTYPTVSFDFAYTKALGEGQADKDAHFALWMVMCCSQAGYVGCVPFRTKGQAEVATCELLAFIQNLGHHAVTYMCENEPNTRAILRSLINARHALGLPTKLKTSKVGDHSNALAENSRKEFEDWQAPTWTASRTIPRARLEQTTRHGVGQLVMQHGCSADTRPFEELPLLSWLQASLTRELCLSLVSLAFAMWLRVSEE